MDVAGSQMGKAIIAAFTFYGHKLPSSEREVVYSFSIVGVILLAPYHPKNIQCTTNSVIFL